MVDLVKARNKDIHKALDSIASRSLNVLKIDSPLHRKCRELLIAAD